jgi:hypothetical protein
MLIHPCGSNCSPLTFTEPAVTFFATDRPPTVTTLPVDTDVESIVFDTVTTPVRFVVPVTDTFPPTLTFFTIPTPPLTTIDPVLVEIESVVLDTLNVPH